MMADLWVLMPSRGRPAAVERAARMYALTCRADTRLHFAFDDDDPALEANIAAAGHHPHEVGPRDGLAGWTNKLAALHPAAPALGSFGDDHVPVTDGWDKLLLAAIPAGGGFAYPNDQHRADIPEAIVVTGRIVAALGWLALPALKHYFIDDVWGTLGRASRIAYCRDVIVRHVHPLSGRAPSDQTYADAAGSFDADAQAYRAWRLRGMRADIATVREACGLG